MWGFFLLEAGEDQRRFLLERRRCFITVRAPPSFARLP
jgi:hypothetical protein